MSVTTTTLILSPNKGNPSVVGHVKLEEEAACCFGVELRVRRCRCFKRRGVELCCRYTVLVAGWLKCHEELSLATTALVGIVIFFHEQRTITAQQARLLIQAIIIAIKIHAFNFKQIRLSPL